MSLTNNATINNWVEEMRKLTKPSRVVWIDGSEKQLADLRAESCSNGEIIELNQEKLPGCYLHRTAVNDVARVEHRTFICTPTKEDAGNTNNWMDPKEAYDKLGKLFDGSMSGRTMYVIPFSMGIIGSEFAKVGIELTDSIYVVLNMAIMTRIGKAVLDSFGNGTDFVRGLHSKAQLDEENRYIVHFRRIIRFGQSIWVTAETCCSAKMLCAAYRVLSGQERRLDGRAYAHSGIEKPNGETKYIAAAFPSACGKTNLAMLIPPEGYRKKGYKVWCVGDDIAWLRLGPDGGLWAMNPESGFFGVAPGTNMKSNPNALLTTKKNTIFTNVVHNLDDNTIWWEGLDNNPPTNALNWKGEKWDPTSGEKGAHPNSRFTAPAAQCPCISPEFENPRGVPISALVFGGRRAKTAPLVYQAFDWNHGVFVGSAMASETTAAASGAVGVVRRDPMAMLPFCGYNMGDYFTHWLEMGSRIKKQPKIFNVNWFRQDENGRFIWPGYGDNMRVLEWIIRRCDDEVDAAKTPIGYIPNINDINIEGIEDEVSVETLKELLSIDTGLWKEDAAGIEEYYNKIGGRMPKELLDQLDALKSRLG